MRTGTGTGPGTATFVRPSSVTRTERSGSRYSSHTSTDAGSSACFNALVSASWTIR